MPYWEVERIRVGDRMPAEMGIGPETLYAQVPNLILQPLVENAICHGIAPRSRSGRLEIRAREERANLLLEVSDNGAGLQGNGPIQEGVGLSNTRARLRELYGPAHQFDLEN